MPQLRVALAQVSPVVGDVRGNSGLVREWVARAAEHEADLVVFPEMVITGYPIEDLVYRESFVKASRAALADLATALDADGFGDVPVVVGYLDADGPVTPGPLKERGHGPRNAAAWLWRGEVISTYFKHHLPNYGVFDEYRHFVPGSELPVVRLGNIDIATIICEDVWPDHGPIVSAKLAGAGLVLCINGSPYEVHKDDVRLELCQKRAVQAGATLAYVNTVGGQDDLVFDGASLIVDSSGELLARATQFEEELLFADLELPAASHDTTGTMGALTITRTRITTSSIEHKSALAPRIAEPLEDDAEIWRALTVGLRDYVHKNGFSSVTFGLSGGIDSALVAVLAADALGPGNVHCVAMPSEYSSAHSLEDAQELARRTGIELRTIPITPMVHAFVESLKLSGLAEENVQARVRGTIVMGISNAEGHLVLAPGNKSEYAVGYSTLYGDMVGAFAPIKDVLKTMVWRLAAWRNAYAAAHGMTPPIPENSISKEPSAELRHGQIDTDSLPPYEMLDTILSRYIDGDAGRAALLEEGFDPDTVDRVLRLVDGAEYKRRQSAPGTKISVKAFGRDRRLPMTSRWREGS
ncbi:MAG: NAD+ synthase [Corynebacteriales bacterium]|nr:NAD+ synthase [Mycobacteriales bacterium]